MVGLVLDALVAVLLVATMVFCFLLNRRLAALRDGHAEMRELIDALGRATERAQASVAQLKAAAREAGSDLGARLDRARAVGQDLARLVAAAERSAKGDEAGPVEAPSGAAADDARNVAAFPEPRVRRREEAPAVKGTG